MPSPTTHIALLRAVNLAGKNMVSMAVLRELLTRLGLHDVQTLLQSGNVVFRAEPGETAEMEHAIERVCRPAFKFDLEVFVRTVKEWNDVIARNPFPDEAVGNPGRLLVMACRTPIAQASVRQLQASIAGDEVVRASGRHLYITYPAGIGTSKLTTAVIEKTLATRGTARNWNTVLALQTRARA